MRVVVQVYDCAWRCDDIGERRPVHSRDVAGDEGGPVFEQLAREDAGNAKSVDVDEEDELG